MFIRVEQLDPQQEVECHLYIESTSGTMTLPLTPSRSTRGLHPGLLPCAGSYSLDAGVLHGKITVCDERYVEHMQRELAGGYINV